MDINARYVEALMKNKRDDKAASVGLECVKKGKNNDKLMDLLKKAYAGNNGANEEFTSLPPEKQKNFDELIAGALKEKAIEINKKVRESRISSPSIDFTLKDLSGKPV